MTARFQPTRVAATPSIPNRTGVARFLPCLLAALVAAGPAIGQGKAPPADNAKQSPSSASAGASARKSPYKPEALTQGMRNHYAATLGVDSLSVRRTNSGNLIRFAYRITDPDKAKAIADRQAKPVLIGHTSRAMLEVPVMDKVGPLRQATRPEAGKEYWMVFSNKGDVVKTGERVSVVVGSFRIDGLRVE